MNMKKKLLLLSILLFFKAHSQIANDADSSFFAKSQTLHNAAKTNSVYNSNALQATVISAKTNGDGSDPYVGPPPPPPFFPYLKLDVITRSDFKRELMLGFVSDDLNNPEAYIDLKNNESLSHDVSFHIEGEQYLIKSIAYEMSEMIPLSVKSATHTTFTFGVNEIVGCDHLESVYIYDSYNKSYHDIKNDTYEVTVGPGTYTERFKISFTDQTFQTMRTMLSMDNSGFFIYQDNANQSLRALNPNNESIQSFTLYDILGNVVHSENNLRDQDFALPTSELGSGIYIAAFLMADDSKKIQKLIISNSRI
jgi:hypothetical protein